MQCAAAATTATTVAEDDFTWARVTVINTSGRKNRQPAKVSVIQYFLTIHNDIKID